MLFMNSAPHALVGGPLSIPDQAKEPDRQTDAAQPIARARGHLNRHLNPGIKASWRLAINGCALPHERSSDTGDGGRICNEIGGSGLT
jgi:hypothetical protein